MDKYVGPDELSRIEEAVETVIARKAKKVQVNSRTQVYIIPSNNPEKYTVRVDIKVDC